MEPKKKWIPGDKDRYINVSFNVVEMPTELGPDDSTSPLFLLPWGETALADAAFRELFGEPGAVRVDDASADMIKINFGAKDIELHVNLDHQYLGDGQAVGWITDVSADEENGLNVEVEWTKEGRALIESKAYRYASGEFSLDRNTGRVVAVTGAALTNRPAAEAGMRPVSLSLITADDDPLQLARHGQREDPNMDLKAFLARLVGRPIEDDGEAVVAASELHTQAQLSEQLTTDLAASRMEVETLTAKLAKLEEAATEAAEAATKARVDAALAKGQISPAQEEWATGQTEDAFDAYLSTVKEGTYTPPKQQVDEKEINKPKSNSAELSDRQALADNIAAYASEKDITFSQASVILGRKGA